MTTTKADFFLFKAECEKWIEILGLKDWEFHFEHGDISEGNVASCQRNCNSRIIKLSLCKEWPKKSMMELNKNNIRLSAFEEVCHTFMYELSSCALTRFVMEHEIEEAEHRIIRILQNTLYPKY